MPDFKAEVIKCWRATRDEDEVTESILSWIFTLRRAEAKELLRPIVGNSVRIVLRGIVRQAETRVGTTLQSSPIPDYLTPDAFRSLRGFTIKVAGRAIPWERATAIQLEERASEYTSKITGMRTKRDLLITAARTIRINHGTTCMAEVWARRAA